MRLNGNIRSDRTLIPNSHQIIFGNLMLQDTNIIDGQTFIVDMYMSIPEVNPYSNNHQLNIP